MGNIAQHEASSIPKKRGKSTPVKCIGPAMSPELSPCRAQLGPKLLPNWLNLPCWTQVGPKLELSEGHVGSKRLLCRSAKFGNYDGPTHFLALHPGEHAPPAEAAGLFESIGPAPKLSRLDRLGTFGAGKIFLYYRSVQGIDSKLGRVPCVMVRT